MLQAPAAPDLPPEAGEISRSAPPETPPEAPPGLSAPAGPPREPTQGSARASAADLPAHVDRAREAQRAWGELPVSARLRAVAPARRRLLEAAERFASLVGEETGKPAAETLLSEIVPSADVFTYWLGHIERLLEGDDVDVPFLQFPGKSGHSYLEARGVVGIITPYNYPVALPLRSIVPALLAGNAVLWKPSELAPRTGELLARIFDGLPYGVFTPLIGGRELGEALARSALDLVLFTGSVASGRSVAAAAAERLVPCSLELGGKDAALVLADADIERAARGVVWGAFTNAGQNCASIERVYVEASVAPAFLARAVELTRALRPGIDVGRLASCAQVERVSGQVREAIASGAELLAGGEQPPAGELFYPPTVLRVTDERTALMTDETFGPVLPVVVVGSAEEAVARANDSRYGLTASVWTRHLGRAEVMARRLRVGVVTVNNHALSPALPGAPFGGRGESGFGVTNGPHALAALTRPRFVLSDAGWARRDLWWYPYTPALLAVARAMAVLRGGGSLLSRISALGAMMLSLPRRLLGG